MSDLALVPLFRATLETIYMVFVSGLLSIVIGLVVGIALFITDKNQLYEKRWLNQTVGFVVNVVRSVPFIILMISIIPLTRLIAGSAIGTDAAIVPLTLAAIPFFARVCESAITKVPRGLIEAAHAMGASHLQIIQKVLIPEALPGLIRGATLTLIGLIGYSAMAGVIGGGGLGELAINYGYQRFNVWVMLETVVLLVIIVQLVQSYGDHLARKPRLRSLLVGCVVLGVVSIACHFWPVGAVAGEQLRVGIVGGPQAQVMQVAKRLARKDYDLDLEFVVFEDYVLPNTALNNGSIDANIFQHLPYLKAQIQARGYHLTPIAKTFVYPMGFYSRRIKKIEALKRGTLVAIPNDPSNEGRALLILQKAHLVRLKKGVGSFATVRDIIRNPRHLRFKAMDAAQLPRVFDDADLVALTNDYAPAASFSIKQALLKEGADSPYANIIVVRTKNRGNPTLKKLIDIMHAKAVQKETTRVYPDGAALRAW